MRQIIIYTLLTASLLYGQVLEDIVVTAKSESLAVDTAGSFSIVSEKEIEQMGGTSINEILEEMVGVSVVSIVALLEVENLSRFVEQTVNTH